MRHTLPILVLIAMSAVSAETTAPAAAMLERIRGLAGDWEGTMEWSGDRTGSGKIGATYYPTGRDSAVVENLKLDSVPFMTTVYHLDSNDLRMTHFCGAQNQPRLKATRIDATQGIADFAFVDATNVGPRNLGHVERLELRLIDAGHITLMFAFGGDGKHSFEHIDLHRVGR